MWYHFKCWCIRMKSCKTIPWYLIPLLSPESLLHFYKSATHLSIEYCCHIRFCATVMYLEILGKTQRRIWNIICPYLASATVMMSFPHWYLDILNLNIVLNWHFDRIILLLKFLEVTISPILIISSLILPFHWWWFWLQVIDDF